MAFDTIHEHIQGTDNIHRSHGPTNQRDTCRYPYIHSTGISTIYKLVKWES